MSFVSLLEKPKIVTLTSSNCAAPSFERVPPERSVPFAHLEAFTQMGAAPAAYLGWLICGDYDAFDVAQTLATAGYEGHCIFVGPTLPNKNMVLRELSSAFPKLQISIWFESEAPAMAEAFCNSLVKAMPARADA